MQTVSITNELSFSRIIQGLWRVTDWNLSTPELTRFLNACMDRGVDTFDVADIYGGGLCEEQVGLALKEIPRSRYKIVSKGGICFGTNGGRNYYNTSYDYLLEACRRSVRKLNCGYLDLYLIHREDPLIHHEEAAQALLQLKADGVIREAGVSNFDPYKFRALNHYMGGTLRTNQIEWNPCCFEHFRSGMMDVLQEERVHPMIWSPLCGGALFRSQEEPYVNARAVLVPMAAEKGISVNTLVYAWILRHPVGAMPLVGSGKLSRLDEAIAALDVELSQEDWFRIYRASGQMILR